jgi:urea transport system permease protein
VTAVTDSGPAGGAPVSPDPATQPARSRFGAGTPLRAVAGFVVAAVVLFGLAPVVLGDFRLGLLAKYLCMAIVAVGIGLAWGRGGMLTLGQGVFFGLGGYAMAMHLKLAEAGAGNLPDFMQLYGQLDALPWWWRPFQNPAFALAATVLLPMLVAFLLGLLVFRRRVRGAYFAILSQALAAAMAIFLIGQQGTTGGTNGLTDIQSFFGYDLNDPVNQRMVYFIVAAALLAVLALAWQLMRSRYGELLVAVRDAEERVRFLGYDPANVKLVAYVVAAGMAGLAGALFVPAVGIISPALIGVVPSIEFVIGVAVGGRASLAGPALGAIAVAWA